MLVSGSFVTFIVLYGVSFIRMKSCFGFLGKLVEIYAIIMKKLKCAQTLPNYFEVTPYFLSTYLGLVSIYLSIYNPSSVPLQSLAADIRQGSKSTTCTQQPESSDLLKIQLPPPFYCMCHPARLGFLFPYLSRVGRGTSRGFCKFQRLFPLSLCKRHRTELAQNPPFCHG
jgi:hypothetical protein